jgi:hypothetical protein
MCKGAAGQPALRLFVELEAKPAALSGLCSLKCWSVSFQAGFER